MSREQTIITLGHVNGVYGVRGWLRVHSYTTPPDSLFDYKHWWLRPRQGQWQALRLVHGRVHGKGLIAQLGLPEGEAFADRDVAAQWLSCEIGVPREDLPRPARGEVYLADLPGLQVVNPDYAPLGEVAEVLETGAHPVLVVKQAQTQTLIPFVRDVYILEIDLDKALIIADWQADY